MHALVSLHPLPRATYIGDRQKPTKVHPKCDNPEDQNLNFHHHENFKYHPLYCQRFQKCGVRELFSVGGGFKTVLN